MKVARAIDTVIIEMDILQAEKLLEVLNQVQDWTDMAYNSDIGDLRDGLRTEAAVRTPSSLWIAETVPGGDVLLRNTTGEEMTVREEALRKKDK